MSDILIFRTGNGIAVEIKQITPDQTDAIYSAICASGISDSKTITFNAKINALCDALKWASTEDPEPSALAALASGWGFGCMASETSGNDDVVDDQDHDGDQVDDDGAVEVDAGSAEAAAGDFDGKAALGIPPRPNR